MSKPTSVDDILEELHEKSLMSGIFNDGKVHTMPSHGTADGCIDEAKLKISSLLERSKLEARIDELKRSIKPQERYDHYCIEKEWIDDRVKELNKVKEKE